MGHHYVPQRYLAHFAAGDRPGHVWQYAKSGGEPRCLPIKVVAQSRGFYDPAMESLLANEVEPRGGEAIEKLLRGEAIGEEGRMDLASYICVAIKRVPAHRGRARALFPEVLASVTAGYRKSIRDDASSSESDPARVVGLLSEVDRIEDRYRSDPPQCVEDRVRDPRPTLKVLEAIFTMDWRLCEADGQPFITSDNPAFFTTGIGLGSPNSEFFLPLSPTHLLHGSRGLPVRGIPRTRMRQSVVRQINKLAAVEAASFVYAHARLPWLTAVVATERHWTYRPTWVPDR